MRGATARDASGPARASAGQRSRCREGMPRTGDGGSGGPHMKTTFVVTVDVESRGQGDPAQDVLGAIPGYAGHYGIERIMDIMEAHQGRATFFLNVYESAKHGDAVMSHAARRIQERGHDLELHTHPRPMFPYYGMSQAPLDQQVAILRRGMSLLEAWASRRAVAHRSGAFAANTDTLRAAGRVGLRADCSLSPGSHVDVPLVAQLGATNAPQRVDQVWEVPMTCFDQVRVGAWHSRRILDIEACSLAEIKHVTRWAVRQGLPSVCLLMHSFSFSRQGRPNGRAIRRLTALLVWLRRQDDVEIGTIEQVCHRLQSAPVPAATAQIPCTGFWLTWRRALGAWNEGLRNLLVAAAGLGGLALIAMALAYAGYRWFRR